MEKVLISLSGGMDSVTLLGKALHDGHDVHLIHFQYGSKHNQQERIAINRVMQHYGLSQIEVVDLRAVASALKSNLLLSGGKIPEGHYEASSMTQTVVPGRNLVFASIAAAIAESNKLDAIWLGIHSGDHAIYPDCRPDFYKALAETVKHSTEGRVRVEAPFLELSKAPILRIGYEIGVPYKFTRTCYTEDVISCGRCGSCQERLAAFAEIQIDDPIAYQSRTIIHKEGAASTPSSSSTELEPATLAAPPRTKKK